MQNIVSSLSLGAALLADPPTFAKDFYTGQQSEVAINQGGYYTGAQGGGACCSLTNSPQCKIQAVNMGQDTREQGSKLRTRTDSAQGAIVTWYGNVSKQMAVLPGAQANSTHKWACAQYCPAQGDFMSAIQIGDGKKGPFDTPKDKGQTSITQPKSIGGATKTCEHWEWTETILYVIPMQTTNFYVDMSANTPAPFFSSSAIKPLGQNIGEDNESFVGYTPNPAGLEDYFDIDPATIASCPMSDNCNNNNHKGATDQEKMMAKFDVFAKFAPKTSVLDEARRQSKEAPLGMTLKKDPPPPPNVTFVSDFSALENSILVMNQGGSEAPNGDPCCYSSTGVPQCQLQLQHQSGHRYLDVTNQRDRFEDLIGKQTTVDDYTALKSMLINVTDGKEWCQEYCPIDPEDAPLTPFDPFDPLDTITDMGSTTWEGETVEHYQWKDKIFKIITMQNYDFYADIANPKAAVPKFLQSELTPFGGPPAGTTNQTWANFTAGVPPAAKFAISGVSTCPRSGNCGDSAHQLHRMRTRQLITFAKYQPHRA